MNVGLVVGLVVAAIGIAVAVVAVVVSLQGPRRTASDGGSGRTFAGWSASRSLTLGAGSSSADAAAGTVPLSDTNGAIAPGADGPDPAGAAWARGDFGERGRTQRGGRAGATALGMRLWHVVFALIVIAALAAALTGGFGRAHPMAVLGSGFAIVVVLAVVFFILYGRHRSASCSAFAVDHGWQYAPANDALTASWSGPPFGRGLHAAATNVVSGTSDGAPFVAFDYTYDLPSADQRTSRTESYSVVVRQLGRAWPNIQFTPASALGRVTHLGQDQFDQVWQVAMPDDASAALLTTPLKDWLMAPEHRRLALRLEGTDLLTWPESCHLV